MAVDPAIYAAGAILAGPSGVGTDGQVLASDGVGGTEWVTPSSGVTDHGALTGLGDDDHTQYVYGAGRAGGQTIVGGTASGDDLTLQGPDRVSFGAGETYYVTSEGRIYATAFAAQGAYFGSSHTTQGSSHYAQFQLRMMSAGNSSGLVIGPHASTPLVRVTRGNGFGWSASVLPWQSIDTALVSPSAGVVAATNGSTGDADIRMAALRLVLYTDGTRPAAGVAGRVIYNSDDAASGGLNIDDGTQWRLTDGTIT